MSIDDASNYETMAKLPFLVMEKWILIQTKNAHCTLDCPDQNELTLLNGFSTED